MKVLKPGREQKGWTKKCRCTGRGNGGGGCGAELLVERADVFRTGNSSYDGDRDYFNTFMCPSCNVCTDLAEVPFTPREPGPEERQAAYGR